MVAPADLSAMRRSDFRRWWTSCAVRRSVDGRVVDPEARLNVPRSAFYVYRAPLPLRLLVPRRRLSPRAARAHRVAARLLRPRAHRPQRAVRLDGVRARIETARSPGDHRRGVDATRRFPCDASRRDA